MVPIGGLLQLLRLAAQQPPKDSAIALIIGVYCLHQRVNGHKEAGQQRSVSAEPECGDEMLVKPNREHS